MTVSDLIPEGAAAAPPPPAGAVPRADFGGPLSMALVVAGFVLIGHVWSLNTGLFLDDHAHFAHLRTGDWSLRSAVESSRLGIVGDVMDLWGRREAGLRFFRPVAFWIMKVEYVMANWRPMPMHAFSLGWHFLCSMLVGGLALRCFGKWFWAIVAASLMAIHPGHVATVYWIACQTELFTTAFLLAGVMAYARAAGWGQDENGPVPWLLTRSAISGSPGWTGLPPALRPCRSLPARLGWGLVAVVCYALALGCRENAVLFPLVCWAGDRLCNPRARRWIRWEHVAMLAVLGGYLALRSSMLGGLSLPARPYLMHVSDPGFARFIAEKLVYYTIGLFNFVPVIPMAGQAFFASRPASFYGTFAFAVIIVLVIWRVYGFRRAVLWPLVWMVCLIAPVLPVFASSHHLYLPGVGAVLIMSAGLAALGGLLQGAPAVRLPRPQVVACSVVIALHAVGLGVLTWASGFAFRAGAVAEDILVQDILQRGRPIRDGDHLFFINVPALAYYAVPAFEAVTGRKDLRGHVLSFSPDLLRMEAPGEVEVLDAHRLRVKAPAGRAYFEGITGRTLLQVMGCEGLPPQGQAIAAGLFSVTPTRVTPESSGGAPAAGASGVEELIFRFEKPLASPTYHFYFGSPQFLAYPLDIIRPLSPKSQPGK